MPFCNATSKRLPAALGGAFLWQVSPDANLWTAFGFGVVGTLGFALFGRGAGDHA